MQRVTRTRTGILIATAGQSLGERWTLARRNARMAPLAILLAAGLCSCAGSGDGASQGVYPRPMSAAESLTGAPVWVTRGCRAHWDNESERRQVLCGVGSATSRRNPLGARETAVARARSAIARSIEVTIESLVRLEDGSERSADGHMRSIVHQLSTASLPGCQTESVWSSPRGEVHALVSLDVDRVKQSVRSSKALSPIQREDLAQRAAAAFAAMSAAEEAAGPDSAGGTTPLDP